MPGGGARRGRLLTFEGGEGAGKSTLVDAVRRALDERGIAVDVSREPGGTPCGERIRRLLLEDGGPGWSPMAEALLHTTARAEHVTQRIRPALRAGRTVLLDRFTDSTRVYQGFAQGLGRDTVDRLQHLAFGVLEPDLTVLLDLPVEIGLERAVGAGDVNRYDRLNVAFHERVRAGFLELAAAEPGRIKVIDAARPIDAVLKDVLALVERTLSRPEPDRR